MAVPRVQTIFQQRTVNHEAGAGGGGGAAGK